MKGEFAKNVRKKPQKIREIAKFEKLCEYASIKRKIMNENRRKRFFFAKIFVAKNLEFA